VDGPGARTLLDPRSHLGQGRTQRSNLSLNPRRLGRGTRVGIIHFETMPGGSSSKRGDQRTRESDGFAVSRLGRRFDMQIGYTMMCEQSSPKELVRDVQLAEQAGFDYAVISDHYSPWLDSQGHAPYAWSVLGAAAQATSRIPLMTYVTCPIRRYHPVVVAQKAATIQLLSDGRFTLGLGAGENLNEHVVGGGGPSADVRHQMLREAVEIIRRLFAGG
jgi:hypothetical protein